MLLIGLYVGPLPPLIGHLVGPPPPLVDYRVDPPQSLLIEQSGLSWANVTGHE